MLNSARTVIRGSLLLAPLMLTSLLPVAAQDRDHRGNQNYYNGVQNGARGGNYDRGRHDHYDPHYDDRYRQNQGGIGPGKGAAIGAAGGAVLGALFGGGLKGAVIGGAAGAGVGAIAGQAAQDHRRDNY